MREVIIYFENGNRSVYYNVDSISWTQKIIYLDIFNSVIDADETVCIEKEQVSQILVNVR